MQQTAQKTMRAQAIDRFGGIQEMSMHTLPVPQVGPDEVLMRVESAGVGVWDGFELEGGFAKLMGLKPTFPYVIGSDGAGVIEAVGSNVKQLKPGDRVCAMSLATGTGFYAQYALVKAGNVWRAPAKLTTEQAGVMPVDAITALRGLDDTLGLRAGETVMIFGASGGIGHLAVQLATRMGARVFAVASGDDGVALVKRLGADVAVNGRSEDVVAAARAFAPEGLDAALLTAGGAAAEGALAAVRNGGRVAYPNGVEPEPKARPGVRVQNYDGMPDRHAIEKLSQLIESGPFEVHVDRTFPLEQAAEAHRASEKHHLGKLALRPI